MRFLFPPRPKGRMIPSDLPLYEKTGDWLAQMKFRGSRAIVFISKDREVYLGSRHGRPFSNFDLNPAVKEELISSLDLEDGKEYLLDGELMNKDVGPKNEIIFFDVLQAGNYLFYKPTQSERLEILSKICRFPTKRAESGIALQVSKNFQLAETFDSNFEGRYKSALGNTRLEGLVLRKKNKGLESMGEREYETPNLIRCRKPFAQDKGYEF